MLLINQNSTQQINAALMDAENNIERRTKTTLISSVISAVYGAVKVMFEELKNTLAKVAHTGDYNDLINKPVVVDTVASGNMNAVTSNAVNNTLANYPKNINSSFIADCNSFTFGSGSYNTDNGSSGTPPNSNYGTIMAYNSQGYTTQIAQDIQSGKMFVRKNLYGTWGNWQELVINDNISKTTVSTPDQYGKVILSFSAFGVSSRPSNIILTPQSGCFIAQYSWDESEQNIVLRFYDYNGNGITYPIRYGFFVIP